MKVIKNTKVTIRLTRDEKDFLEEIQSFLNELWDDFSKQVPDRDISFTTRGFTNSITAINGYINNLRFYIEEEDATDDDE